MDKKEVCTTALAAIAAVTLGIVIAGSFHFIGGLLSGDDGDDAYPEFIVTGITGNWSYRSDNDFRFISFNENYTFTFEQWTLKPYTTHVNYNGVWGETKTGTYLLYLDIIRPDIPALHSPYRLEEEDTGTCICSVITDRLERKYYPEEFCAGDSCSDPDWKNILRLREKEYLISGKEFEEAKKEERKGILYNIIKNTAEIVFGRKIG